MLAGADSPRSATDARRASGLVRDGGAYRGAAKRSRRSQTPLAALRRPAASAAGVLLKLARSDESGLALLEVVISSLLVAIIAIGVLDGFDGAARVTTDERLHDQAAVLASQSQEELRSDPASALDALQNEPHVYTRTLGTETFTITQQTEFVNGSTGSAGCTATSGKESDAGGQYIRVASTVTWPQLEAANRPSLRQASVITPPDGSALEVDVTNGAATPVPIEGVTVHAAGVQTTTGSKGCVIYGSIPSTSVELNVHKLGYVTPAGVEEINVEEVGIAPNLTTHYPVTLAPAGRLEGHYTYKGESLHDGANVEGDKFVVSNTGIGVSSNFELGGTNGTYATTGLTADNLFPFETQWSVYAGDCPADSPALFKDESAVNGVTVVEGTTTSVNVPMSHVALSVYTGSDSGTPGTTASTTYPVKISDSECKSAIPANASSSEYEHSQETTTSGHLTHPFQPFGRWALCLYDSATQQTYTAAYENTTEEGSEVSIYLGATGTEAGVTLNEVTVVSKQATNTC